MDYWSLGGQANGTAAKGRGTSVVLRLQRLNFFCSEKKLSHLVLDETSDLKVALDIRPVVAPINLDTILQIPLCM